MNKGRLIWGIICLALAGLLMILNLVLPEEDMVFMIGDTNMSYLPPIILAIVGIVLLTTAKSGVQKAVQESLAKPMDTEKVALNKRLETIGWGFFLVMLGGFMFIPHTVVARGFWSIGVGLIMLGLNIARYFFKIKMSGFTTILGSVSLIVGIAQLNGMQAFEGAILLVIIGIYLIFKQWFDKRTLFGKVEESNVTSKGESKE